MLLDSIEDRYPDKTYSDCQQKVCEFNYVSDEKTSGLGNAKATLSYTSKKR